MNIVGVALHLDPRTAEFRALKLALAIVQDAQKSKSLDDPNYLAHLDGAELGISAALDFLNPGWDAGED